MLTVWALETFPPVIPPPKLLGTGETLPETNEPLPVSPVACDVVLGAPPPAFTEYQKFIPDIIDEGRVGFDPAKENVGDVGRELDSPLGFALALGPRAAVNALRFGGKGTDIGCAEGDLGGEGTGVVEREVIGE